MLTQAQKDLRQLAGLIVTTHDEAEELESQLKAKLAELDGYSEQLKALLANQ